MKEVVANLDNDWTLGSEDIDAFLRRSSEAREQRRARVPASALVADMRLIYHGL